MSILSAANPQSSALLTDLYQLTMLQGYFDQRMKETAVFEFFVRKLPRTRNFLLAAGLEQALAFLETVRFTPAESRCSAATTIMAGCAVISFRWKAIRWKARR